MLWLCSVLLLVCLGCDDGAKGHSEDALEFISQIKVATLAFDISENAFAGELEKKPYPPWDVVATDMDLDGDVDVLINWHHLQRPELFENIGGNLVLKNPRSDDRSGFYDNDRVPELFEKQDIMLASIDPKQEGIYVWHDFDRLESWNVYIVPSAAGDYDLELHGNVAVIEKNIDPAYYTPVDNKTFIVHESTLTQPLHIRLKLNVICHTLALDATPKEGMTTFPVIYAGMQQVPFTAGYVALTKPDPHGVVWVDGMGSPEPELYFSRGSVRGMLVPPEPGKIDQFFTWSSDTHRMEFTYQDAVPRDHGRGRQVAWFDADHKGSNELLVSAYLSNNRLLTVEGDTLVDIAEGMNLAKPFMNFAVLDLDEDGWDDLITLDVGGLFVALNKEGQYFEFHPGEEFGLALPFTMTDVSWESSVALHVLDLDNDGDLDIWLTGLRPFESVKGDPFSMVFYQRDKLHFEDITEKLGMSDIQSFRYVLPGDFDNDGLVDGFGLGASLVLLKNLGPAGFQTIEPDPVVLLQDETVGFVADLDNDGWLDAITAMGKRLRISNKSTGNSALMVYLTADGVQPIGAIVRAYYANGSVRAQRYGSAASTRWSQTLLPLHFGIPLDGAIREIGIVWPGDSEEIRTSVEIGQTVLSLKR
ncbi:MAG: hypothetical protein AUK47_13220 [Deltaproteobacteria bacterium CG2_30_63_29]|nr:MAG: hypothetical protein AUK47_13220 [Deltaproteobacteria bacterium CG2_30_63_29]